jgi:hypothetical protein
MQYLNPNRKKKLLKVHRALKAVVSNLEGEMKTAYYALSNPYRLRIDRRLRSLFPTKGIFRVTTRCWRHLKNGQPPPAMISALTKSDMRLPRYVARYPK